MKCRVTIIVCVIFLSHLPLRAQDGRKSVPLFTYGLEWSYSAIFNVTWHHNFIADDGRVNIKGTRLLYENHGEILAHAGINVGNNVNLSIYTGYTGIIGDVRLLPISLRCTWFYGRDAGRSRWFSFIDSGSGISLSRVHASCYSGKAGGGYRVRLSRSAGLDFNIAYRLTYAAPDIYDYGDRVPESDIKRNDNYLSSVMIGIGLTF